MINSKNKKTGDYLAFESTIVEIDNQIAELTRLSSVKGIDYSTEIRQLQREQVAEFKRIYSNLSAWQTVQVARHPKRPLLGDYLNLMIKDFRQLHGDRCFGDDAAIVCGLGHIGRENVLVVGQNKGRDVKEKIKCNFGCPNPEGYRKALAKMKFAEKFNIPVVTFIDTPGAYPGIGAEERGQAQAIAVNLMEMSRLKVPIICIVIGEGGSGGALGIGVGDRMAILEYAYYSVISPEGCAAILWRDGSKAQEAAEALKLTSRELQRLGIADSIIAEPLGGAHRNIHDAVFNVEQYIIRTLRELKRMDTDSLLESRYKKLRAIGQAATMIAPISEPEHKPRISAEKIITGTKIKPTKTKALEV
ncbi:MAG: acetyl-CoA carboxylase carboxyltransferase subunit alpha [Planctomycetes bacterium GWF2_41_51]|nr:MAG: acetyl-CoA carboxylase carboxyltransferase subunit alpha [Planctomycetes bacterium GWF2_41_51]HBG27855.1 acetyl-CoA carboxylase carboxyl transferase subunit alpha [Phycisphaerales bacterium]